MTIDIASSEVTSVIFVVRCYGHVIKVVYPCYFSNWTRKHPSFQQFHEKAKRSRHHFNQLNIPCQDIFVCVIDIDFVSDLWINERSIYSRIKPNSQMNKFTVWNTKWHKKGFRSFHNFKIWSYSFLVPGDLFTAGRVSQCLSSNTDFNTNSLEIIIIEIF